jgi:hypothetical protein
MDMKWIQSEIAILGIAMTLVIAIIAALAAYLASMREQRRNLYSEAIQAVVSWKEMLYRIRRRESGQEREIIDLFHKLQDELSYYESWIVSESKYMSRSYLRLVQDVELVLQQAELFAGSEAL